MNIIKEVKMASKILGYVLAGIGIVIIALMKPIQAAAPIIPQKPPYVLLAGIALVIIGVAFLMSKSSKEPKEVPIYEGHAGNKIVGYRRLKK